VKNALKIKSLNPKARVKVLYRDMRMYGHLEEHYARARHAGVLFLRYEEDRKPVVNQKDGSLELSFYNPVLREDMTLRPDLLVLSAAVLPSDTEELSKMLKCSRTTDGFFLEAHMKLRPVDFATEGIYLCGLAHAPKTIDESLSQAAAAVSRACTILSKDQIQVGGIVSVVDPDKCAACLTCVRVCPYNVPHLGPEPAEGGDLIVLGAEEVAVQAGRPGDAVHLLEPERGQQPLARDHGRFASLAGVGAVRLFTCVRSVSGASLKIGISCKRSLMS
jgi:heterodisulfide reductase subunit A